MLNNFPNKGFDFTPLSALATPTFFPTSNKESVKKCTKKEEAATLELLPSKRP